MSDVYYGARSIENLIYDVLEHGVDQHNERTNTLTRSIFDAKLIIEEGDFPWQTNHICSPRLSFLEMWFFLNGKTNTKELEEQGCFFWRGNTSKEFQESVGLSYLNEGDLGAAYSIQWRSSGDYDYTKAYLTGTGANAPLNGKDQLKSLVDGLMRDKYGRRHIVELWNPKDNEHGVLTPCWKSLQAVVLHDKESGLDVLHFKLINRSLDCLFGARFAIQQYRMFQMALCKWFGFELGRLSCDLSHVHIYENQFEYCKEMLTREYVDDSLCSIELTKEINSLEDLLSIQWEDWNVVYETNRTPFKTPRPDMIS